MAKQIEYDPILQKFKKSPNVNILSVTGWSGRADNYSSLPTASAHNGEYWHVLNAEGVWMVNRKPEGTYYSDGVDWTYLGDLINAFSTVNFDIYDGIDNTKVLNFDVSGITSNNTRIITVADYNYDMVNPLVDTRIFNTSYTPTGSEVKGTTYWDEDNHTISTVLDDGIIGQHFKEAFIDGQNDTGVTIANGTPVEYAGSIGNSGNFKIQKAQADPTTAPFMFVGLTTHQVSDGEIAHITTRGKVRGIQTDGANMTPVIAGSFAVGKLYKILTVGTTDFTLIGAANNNVGTQFTATDVGVGTGTAQEVWAAGDIVYLSTVLGELTFAPPDAPNPAIPVALVISAHASNGTLEVRPTYPESLQSLIDVNGTTPNANGQMLLWDEDNSFWNPLLEIGLTYNSGSAYLNTSLVAASDLHITCGSEKTIVLDSPVYDDLAPYPIIAFKPSGAGTDPTLTTFVGNIQQYTFAINDLVDTGVSEVTHKYAEGTDITIHIHWATNGQEGTDKDVNFQVEYSIANGLSAFSGSTPVTTGDTTIPANTLDRTHYITGVGTIDGSALTIGAYITFAVSRIGLVGAGTDPAADPFIIAVGFHCQNDTMGSRQLFVK